MEPNPTAPTSNTPVQNPAPASTTPLQSPTVVATPTPKKKFGMSKKWLLIILVLLGVVAIAGAGGFYFMNQSKSEDQTATASPTPSPTSDSTTDWKTSENKEYNYSFKYPSDWYTYSFNNYPYPDDPGIGDPNTMLVTTSSKFPNLAAGDGPNDAYIGFQIQKLDPEFEEYVADLKNDPIYNVEFKESSINGNKAYKITQADGDIIWLISDSSGKNNLSIPILSDSAKSTDIKTIEQIISTFKFTNSTSSSAETDDLKTYNDTVNKISFKYPPSWTAKSDKKRTFNVFLDPEPFEFCTACDGFSTAINVSFNEAMDTVTEKKYYMDSTLSTGEKRIKELLDPATVKVQKLTVGGKQAVQITGVGGPGPLEGMDFKYTLIQLDNKLLIVDVSEKDYFEIYDQILSSIKFN